MKACINGVTIGYTDRGEGLPVVLLHAFPLHRGMWHPQVESLARSYRVITMDLRGHGESDAPLWRYSVQQVADDVRGLLDHLSIRQAVFAGLSMGGYVLFALYRQDPRRVRALILADTRAQADTPEGRAARFHLAQTAYRQGPGAVADVMIPKLLSPATHQANPDLVLQVRAMIERTDISGIAGSLMAMADRPDSVSLLEQVTCSTQVIVGDLDVATPRADAELLAERIPGARLAVIPGAGHLSNLEQPDRFTDVVRSFLSDLPNG